MKKSICFIHKDIGDLERGGISVSYKYLIHGFCASGWTVYVITQKEFTAPGVVVFRVPAEKNPYVHSKNVSKILSSIEDKISIVEAPNYKFELLDYLKTRKNNKLLTSVRSNPSCVTLLFGTDYLEGESQQSRLADYNLAVSKFSKDDVEHYYNISVDEVIYEGIELDLFFNHESKDTLDSGYHDDGNSLKGVKIDELIDSKKINLFWCGKPTYMKGYDYLVDIINQRKEAFHFILNTTPITQALNKKLDSNANYSFIWSLNRNDQLSIWKKCRATLITSRVEGFSYVNAESYLLRKPVLANKQCLVLKELPIQNHISYFNPIDFQDFETVTHASVHNEILLNQDQVEFLSSQRLVKESISFYERILKI